MNRKNGFTMIELMIVIIIIGILATVGGSTYIKSLQKGRDTQRVSDLKEIQKGFETYYAKVGSYAAPSKSMFVGQSDIFPSGEIMNKITKSSYSYSNDSDSAYCVCVAMESKNSAGEYMFANSAVACNFAGAKTHYCVQNVQ